MCVSGSAAYSLPVLLTMHKMCYGHMCYKLMCYRHMCSGHDFNGIVLLEAEVCHGQTH